MGKHDAPPRDPFSDSATPSTRPSSHCSQPSEIPARWSQPSSKRRFRSYRLKGEYEKPWLSDRRLRRTRCGDYIVWAFIVTAFIVSGYINYSATTQISRHNYCLILDETFSTIDPAIWNHEVQVNGFGTGAFDWTTTDPANSYVDQEGLHIVPSLTNLSTSITPAEIVNGYTLNLTKAGGDGSCTGTTNAGCSIHSNSTLNVPIPPVRSARLNTKGKKSIKYGRVEVVAKLPAGDWLWPAIWMMPENDTYGEWPASGEIDIAESRGNSVDYPDGGRDQMLSTLHWGPTGSTDAFWRSSRARSVLRTDLSEGFHTYGMEWTENYLFTYLDSRLEQVLYWKFPDDQDMWQQGYFAGETVNSSLLVDPWSQTGRPNTPFDQPFYLILNVAVGSTNGWFKDGVGNKPWTDQGHAASDFYKSVNTWYPTWGAGDTRGMTVQSVRMWQQGTCS